jgi:ketosteroid isomerase-like protein
VILCAGARLSFAQERAASSNNKPEDQVKQLEHDWLAADAKGDRAALRRIISDDFIGSSFDGGLLNRGDIIPERPSGPGGFAGATPGETNVLVFGDTAVLMGVINTASGPQPKPIHVTVVCQKNPQGWQMIAVQLTHI